MPNIKLKDGSGIEQTYSGIDTITVPLADGTGNWAYGLTDSELIITDGTRIFANTSPLYTRSNYFIGRSNFSNVSKASEMFYNNLNITDLSQCTFNFSNGASSVVINGMFDGCMNLRKLPTFTQSSNLNINQSSGVFANCRKLENDEYLKFTNLIGTSAPQQSIFQKNYNFMNVDLSNMQINEWKSSHWRFQQFMNNENNLRSLKLPGWKSSQDDYPITSGSYYLSGNFKGMYMLNSLTFSLDSNNQPFKAKIKNQSFWVTGSNAQTGGYGHCHYYINDELKTYPDTPITDDDNVFRDITSSALCTVENMQAGYNRVKNRPNWCSFGNNISITYEGKYIGASRLTSRFNHDSIVAFFNTVPDTSEYLAEVGGTNTLKLLRFQGDLTDEGGVSDLTEEEIAVATNKGWTVVVADS